MPGSGTRAFLEPDHYEASLRPAQINIVIALGPKFKARLTWAELHDLQVLRCEEDFPRVAYVCLAPKLSFVTFPAHSGPLPVWGGHQRLIVCRRRLWPNGQARNGRRLRRSCV
jgi:hypothetical protein